MPSVRFGPSTFLPLLGEFLASLRQQTVKATFTDPTSFFNGLRDARSLLGLPAHLVYMHPALLAGAAGATVTWEGAHESPRIPDAPWRAPDPLRAAPAIMPDARALTAVEVFARLAAAEANVPRGMIVPGPTALASIMYGPDVFEAACDGDPGAEDALEVTCGLLIQVVRACGELGLDILAVHDDALPGIATRLQSLLALLWTPLVNVAGFYDSPVLLSARNEGCDRTASALARLRPWVFVTDHWEALLRRELPCELGIGLTPEQLSGDQERVLELLDGMTRKSLLVSTVAPLPADVPVGSLRAVRHQLST